ncbi:C-C motif chemokine 20 [Channa argus]|uniref:C-C motif chemokine n=2 Tax=Channa argus TaxID=215402 RepID=A0A6G1Q9P6_CHAAH|nr:C-C motif chemokine 20 [Channa argus]
MVSRGLITVTTVLLCLMPGLLGPGPASCSQSSKACCTTFNRKPIPFQRIKGYRLQTPNENCNIEAIILYTAKNVAICVTRKDEWVRKTLDLLSSKLKKMSKKGSAGRRTRTKSAPGHLPFNDGNGSFFSTTEPFLNDTEIFY